MKEFSDLMRKYFPNDRLTSLNFYGMSGAYTIVDALKRAGKDLTREKVVEALEQTKDGFAGPGACKVNFTSQTRVGCLEGTMWKLVGDKIVNVGPVYRDVSN